MKIVHLRFDDTLLASLARLREGRERFQRLLADRPTGIRVKTRAKNPEADLRRQYRKVFAVSLSLSAVLHVMAFVVFPTFEIRATASQKDQVVIHMEDIPQTRQIERPPPPPRPAVPIEVESDDVPDDVTIESTDLDFDEVPIDVPPPPRSAQAFARLHEEEEVLEIWKVEKKPEVIKQAIPEYPELARKAGLKGTVYVKILVTSEGKVKEATVLRGPEIFRKAAVKAAYQFLFKPAIQNDKPVPVWAVIPMEFKMEGL